MQEAKVITEAQAKEAMAEPMAVKPSPPKRFQVAAPYFASYIRKELPRYVSPDALEAGGLTVETTVDLKWQLKVKRLSSFLVQNFTDCV